MTEADSRDALEKVSDRALEHHITATRFAIVLAYGRPEHLSVEQVREMARRYLELDEPVERYFRGEKVAPCAEERQ